MNSVYFCSMKAFRVIFTMYIFYLLMLPCVDDVVQLTPSSEFQITQQTDHQHHLPYDACSPFCFCSCCNVTVALTNFFFDTKPVLTCQDISVPIIQGIAFDFIPYIWQPPKSS